MAKAQRFEESGNLKASAIELKNALGKNPDNPETRKLLGLVMLQMGDGAAAEKELKRALELGTPQDAVNLPLAEAFLLEKKFEDVLDLGDVPESLPAAERAKLLAYRGDAWRGVKKPDRARAEYERALALNGELSQAKEGLARLAVANRDLTEARRLITEALATDPGNGNLWRLQGQLFYEQRKLEEAESSFSRAVEKNSLNAVDLAMRAIIRATLKKAREAEGDIEELKKKAPHSFYTHYAAGIFAFMQNRLPVASAELEEAHRIDEQFVPILFFLGSAKFRLGQLEQADQLISQYLLSDPDSKRAILVLALIKFNERRFDSTLDLLLSNREQFSKQEFPLAMIGLSEFALGRTAEGLKHFRNAVELASISTEMLKQFSIDDNVAGNSESGEGTGEAPENHYMDLFPGRLAVAMGYIKAGQLERAQRVAETMKPIMKGSPLPETLLGMISRWGSEGRSKRHP